MRYLVLVLALTAVGTVANAKPVQVDGHIRRDGTYVPPHSRSSPNSTINDNWSTKPNVNPTTGKSGTLEPTWGTPSTSNSKKSRGY